MKHAIFLWAIFSTILLATTLSIKDIDQKVSQIQSPRGGLDGSLFNKVSDPFVYYDRNKTTGAIIMPKGDSEESNATRVSAIMNGKAFIGGGWKKVGDTTGSYKITGINSNCVYLNNGKNTKKVFLNNSSKEKNLIKIQGR
ncbi:MAG: hypothetical protein PHI79_01500 [Sulfurovaceae bacterium]|nr:hypothetical protein [Sulfurovaceae bacterium]MDD5548251.1 hypothetical protein [Sulfurovaceae bacterium]